VVTQSSRLCFVCGASYFVSDENAPLFCRNDGSPLGVLIVGKRWLVDGLLAAREGGGIFSCRHTLTGARGALTLIFRTKEREHDARIKAELQVQNMLDPHPCLLKLLEVGKDQDGSRFYVSELQNEKLLSECLKSWRRPDDPGDLFTQAASLLAPLLRLLSAAHRWESAHGELDATRIFVTAGDPTLGDAPVLSMPRLYGLRYYGNSPELADIVRRDLLGCGRLLYFLLMGFEPELPLPKKEQDALRRRFGTQLGDFVLRALGGLSSDSRPPFAIPEEMLVALGGLPTPRPRSSEQLMPLSREMADAFFDRTVPAPPPSRMSGPRVFLRTEHDPPAPEPLNAIPEFASTPSSGPYGAKASHLSSDLQMSSFADLVSGSQSQSSGRNEIVARGRYRVSMPDGTSPGWAPPPVGTRARDEASIEVVDLTGDGPTAAKGPATSFHEEQTRPSPQRDFLNAPPFGDASPVGSSLPNRLDYADLATKGRPRRQSSSAMRAKMWRRLFVIWGLLLPVSLAVLVAILKLAR
jgi:hypothetical protein